MEPDEPFAEELLDDRELWKRISAIPLRDKDAETPPLRDVHQKKPSKKELRRARRPFCNTPVDSEIDLHGCTAEEAAFKLEREIALAVQHDWKTLRVIHGGIPGMYGPVQKAVERMVKTTHSRQIASSKLEESNSGATILFLKPNS